MCRKGERDMQLRPLGDVELRYTSLASLDYGTGGQLYGTMEGWLRGEALRGDCSASWAPKGSDPRCY